MANRTFFIKPSRPITGEKKLDPILVAGNKFQGIETTLTLDTNILIGMEKVVKNGNKWSSVKLQGLHNLVSLLQRCPPQSICISPGLAFKEMPPQLANQSKEYYELFCQAHLPGFVDVPGSTRTISKVEKEAYGFKDLSFEGQALMAVSFASIIYLNLIDRVLGAKPIEKFKMFLDLLEREVTILSAAEIEVAKYCFAEPPATSRQLIDIRKRIRKNFLKTSDEKIPKNSAEILSVAFNGANDLSLVQSANIIDEYGFDGMRQDSWIATKDKKLVDFCDIFHHVNIDGEAGKYAASSVFSEHSDDMYWLQAESHYGTRNLMRKKDLEFREIEMAELVDVANRAISAVNSAVF